ncbi:hypothetical protein Tco_1397188, partial [Tanacetum coccineum]
MESDDNREEGEGFVSGNFEEGERAMKKGNRDGIDVNDKFSAKKGLDMEADGRTDNGTKQGSVQGSNVSVDEKGDSGKKEVNAGRMSFVEAMSGSMNVIDRSLECIPTELDDNGVEVVVFDDIMVAEGSKRSELTLCG